MPLVVPGCQQPICTSLTHPVAAKPESVVQPDSISVAALSNSLNLHIKTIQDLSAVLALVRTSLSLYHVEYGKYDNEYGVQHRSCACGDVFCDGYGHGRRIDLQDFCPSRKTAV